MEINIHTPYENQQYEFAELRARAMKDSLLALNRYDETRVRDRVLSDYNPSETKAIYSNNMLAGFYAIKSKDDCKYIAHLYIEPSFQGSGIGSIVLRKIIDSHPKDTLKLNALKGSRSNIFYQRHGFVMTNQDEFDVYYELKPVECDHHGLNK
jgi:GNAT superfamily N-acetyltransferase